MNNEMSNYVPKEERILAKKHFLTQVVHFLKPLGFRRRGMIFFRDRADVTHYIAFLRFGFIAEPENMTVEIGVFPKDLLTLWPNWYAGNAYDYCPVRIRLSSLAHQHQDWWSIRSLDDAEKTSRDLIALISEFAIPLLDPIETTADAAGLLRRRVGNMSTRKIDLALADVLERKVTAEEAFPFDASARKIPVYDADEYLKGNLVVVHWFEPISEKQRLKMIERYRPPRAEKPISEP